MRAEAALREAAAADARLGAGEAPGALHGVPITVKDLCAMAGAATRAGGFFIHRFRPGRHRDRRWRRATRADRVGRAATASPLGFQLIGPALSQAVLLSAGAGYEAAAGFADDHPAL